MAKSKFGCGPIGLLVLVVIVFGAISGNDDDGVGGVSREPVVLVTSNAAGIAPTTLFVAVDALNVREAPTTDAGRVSRGEAVTLTRREGGWYGAELTDGSIGWVHGDYLTARRPSAPIRLTGDVPPASAASGGRCHPSYACRCLPIVSDIDYSDIAGSVRVVGPDVYRLDRDRDGVGCE